MLLQLLRSLLILRATLATPPSPQRARSGGGAWYVAALLLPISRCSGAALHVFCQPFDKQRDVLGMYWGCAGCGDVADVGDAGMWLASVKSIMVTFTATV